MQDITPHSLNHLIFVGVVLVKCSQDGKQHSVIVQDLTKTDGSPVSSNDLYEGSSLMVERNQKMYPVEFVKFKGLKFMSTVGLQTVLVTVVLWYFATSYVVLE